MSREGRDRPSKGIKEPRHRQTLENRCAARSYMIGQCLEHQINSARVDYQRCNIKPFFFPWIPVILGKRQKSEKIPFSAGSIGLTSVRQHKESIRQSPPPFTPLSFSGGWLRFLSSLFEPPFEAFSVTVYSNMVQKRRHIWV